MPNGFHPQNATGAGHLNRAAGQSSSRAALNVDLAVPVIRQQTASSQANPVSVLKEASDKQKVECKIVDRTVKTGELICCLGFCPALSSRVH